jgi:hypothetical protein
MLAQPVAKVETATGSLFTTGTIRHSMPGSELSVNGQQNQRKEMPDSLKFSTLLKNYAEQSFSSGI